MCCIDYWRLILGSHQLCMHVTPNLSILDHEVTLTSQYCSLTSQFRAIKDIYEVRRRCKYKVDNLSALSLCHTAFSFFVNVHLFTCYLLSSDRKVPSPCANMQLHQYQVLPYQYNMDSPSTLLNIYLKSLGIFSMYKVLVSLPFFFILGSNPSLFSVILRVACH